MNATMHDRDTSADRDVPEPTPEDSADLIRADIVVTRAQLGDTVEALTSKMDVRSRMRDMTRDGVETVRRQWMPLAMMAAAVVVIGIGVALGRRSGDDKDTS